MKTKIENAVVRIRTNSGKPVGAGFLVTDSHILTCAHVIDNALERPRNTQEKPSSTIHFDFPLINPDVILKATVYVWQPLKVDMSGDIAVLEFRKDFDLPSRAKPIKLIQIDEVGGHLCHAFGYPEHYLKAGRWSSGILSRKNAFGWVQIENNDRTKHFITKGFSGGMVWDDELNYVVGMVVAVDDYHAVAAMIPTEILKKAWSDLPVHLHSGKLYNVPSLTPHFLLRKNIQNSLKKLLIGDTIDISIKKPSIIGIHGMAGIGKSVIAATLARSLEVRTSFKDGIIWLNIGRKLNTSFYLLEQVARIFGYNFQNYSNEIEIAQDLQGFLENKSFLFILDDLWEVNHAKLFLNITSETDCRFIITTRNAELLTTLGAFNYSLDLMSLDESLILLADWAGINKNDLPKISNQIVKECGKLPLAISICGALIRDGLSWDNLYEALIKADINYLEYQQHSVTKSFKVSIDTLPREEAMLYYDIAIFYPDIGIPEKSIITFWEYSCNFKSYQLEKILIKLAKRALIRLEGEVPNRNVVLHDLLRDYLLLNIDQIKERHCKLLCAYNQKCDGKWYNGPNDGYFFQNLSYHLVQAERTNDLYNLLIGTNDWLEASSNSLGNDSGYFNDLFRLQKCLPNNLNSSSLIKLSNINVARQVIGERINDYDNLNLATLVILDRKKEAIANLKMCSDSRSKYFGLLSVFRITNQINEPDYELLNDAWKVSLELKEEPSLMDPLSDTLRAHLLISQILMRDGRFDQLHNLVSLFHDDDYYEFLTKACHSEKILIDAPFNKIESNYDLKNLDEVFILGYENIFHNKLNSFIIDRMSDSNGFKIKDLDNIQHETYNEVENLIREAHKTTKRIIDQYKSSKSLLFLESFINERFLYLKPINRDYLLLVLIYKISKENISLANKTFDFIIFYKRFYRMLSSWDDILYKSVKGLAKAGYYDLALKIALNFLSDHERSRSLLEVIKNLSDKFLHKKIKKIINKISDNQIKVQAIASLSVALTKCGKIKSSFKVINEIDDHLAKAFALSHIGATLYNKDEDRSFQTINKAIQEGLSIKCKKTQRHVLDQISLVLTESRLYDKALEVTDLIEDKRWKTRSYGRIAVALIETNPTEAYNNFEKAISIARSIRNFTRRIDCLCAIAAVVGEIKPNWADKIFFEVKTKIEVLHKECVAGNLGDDVDIFGNMNRLSDSLIFYRWSLTQLGRYDEAEKAAMKIMDDYYRTEQLKELVSALSLSGHLKKAEKLAESIGDDKDRSLAYYDLAVGYFLSHRFKEAFRAISISAVGGTSRYFNAKAPKTIRVIMGSLSDCISAFEKFEPKLGIKLFSEAARIVSWVNPRWKEIQQSLNEFY